MGSCETICGLAVREWFSVRMKVRNERELRTLQETEVRLG